MPIVSHSTYQQQQQQYSEPQIRNVDVFWSRFNELEKQSPSDKIVVGKKLKASLVSSNKFLVGDAVLMIEYMVRIKQIEQVQGLYDSYRRVMSN